MTTNTDQRDRSRIREQQGSTFLWTEIYGRPARTLTLREELRDVLFASALLVLAAGVAGFLTMDPVEAHGDATVEVTVAF